MDTGVSEEFYGAVYYCRECVGDMASFFGYISPSTYIEMQSQNWTFQQDLLQLQLVFQKLQVLVQELTNYGNLIRNNPDLLSFLDGVHIAAPDETYRQPGTTVSIREGVLESDSTGTIESHSGEVTGGDEPIANSNKSTGKSSTKLGIKL